MSGFDCQFIKEPAEYLQCYCPICLLILREPHQVTCCGKSFCGACIQPVQAINQKCPTCNQKRFSSFENKGLQQPLYGFQVFCSNKKEGCGWKGELGQLDQHLNVNPDKKKLLVGCANTKLKCSLCGRPYQRREMEHHQTSECLMKQAVRGKCKSTREDVVTSHHISEHDSRPVECYGASQQHQQAQLPTSVAPPGARQRLPAAYAPAGHMHQGVLATVTSAISTALDLNPLVQTFKALLPRVSADSGEVSNQEPQHLEHQQPRASSTTPQSTFINVNAPINKKAPIIANAPITVNAPLNVQAQINVNAPLRVEAPMTIKAQLTVNAEMVVAFPMFIKAPLTVNAPVVVNAPVTVKNWTKIDVPMIINKATFL